MCECPLCQKHEEETGKKIETEFPPIDGSLELWAYDQIRHLGVLPRNS